MCAGLTGFVSEGLELVRSGYSLLQYNMELHTSIGLRDSSQ